MTNTVTSARSRWILRATCVALIAGCQSESMVGPSQLPPQVPVIVSPQTHIVDSAATRLLRDSVAESQGTFRFQVLSGAPAFVPGQAIAGAQGPGFMKRVLSSTRVGDIITVQTEHASLADIVEQGSLRVSGGIEGGTARALLGSPGALAGTDAALASAISGTVGHTWSVPLTGLKLFTPTVCGTSGNGEACGDFEVGISSGSFSFTPEFRYYADLPAEGPAYFQVGVSGAVALDLDAYASFSGQLSETVFERRIATVTKRVWAGPELPFVWLTFELTLIAAVRVEAQGALTLRSGVTASGSYDQAIIIQGGRWFFPSTANFDASLKQFSVETPRRVGLRVELQPELHVYVNEVAGPYINASAYAQASRSADGSGATLRLTDVVEWGIDGEVGAEVRSIAPLERFGIDQINAHYPYTVVEPREIYRKSSQLEPLAIASILPTGTQTLGIGDSQQYTISVRNSAGPVAGAAVRVLSDGVSGVSFLTSPTDANGVVTYSTSVPSGKAPGTYPIEFAAEKDGFAPSPTMTRSVTVRPSTTGLLTLSSSACIIPAGSSSCNVSVLWNTLNPTGTSTVTSEWPGANTIVATGNSGGPLVVPVPLVGRSFYLYHNASLLSSQSASASCASGTAWNGSSCQTPPAMTGTLTLSKSTCTISPGASTCNLSISWGTTNAVLTSTVTSDWPTANTAVATGNSGGPFTVQIPFGGRSFYLYNNAHLLASGTATASCAAGATWNGSSCQPEPENMSGTLILSASACTIASGASTCNLSVSWSTTNPVATSAVTSSWPSANTIIANGNSGGPMPVPVPFGGRTFHLYNNGQQLASRSATAACAAGATWNGSSCQTAPPAMSGNLALSASSCTIAAGASTCNLSMSWGTTNPVATSTVTSDWPSANTTVATGNSGGPSTVQIPFNGRNFYLYNNAQLLATRSATAACTAGATWNGNTCQTQPGNMTGTLTLSASSCTIAAGAGVCSVSVSWGTTNPVATSAVTSDWPSANTTVATGNSGGPLSVTVPFGGRTLYLYNNAQQLATRSAAADCASGTTWNGTVCQTQTLPTTGTLTLSASSCTIAAGAGACNVSVSWNTTNPAGTSAVTSDWPSANTTLATGNSGGPLSVAVPFGGRTLYLYNNAQQLASRSAAADCASGTTWNGTVCQAQTLPTTGTLTLSASSCTIAAGAEACNVSVSWTTTNPVGTSAVTSSWPSANTTLATGNSGGPLSVAVPFSGRIFYLYNNTQQLASRSAAADCAPGTTWNGTVCQTQSLPTTGTLTLSSSSCTIAAGAGACNVSVSWNTTSPVGTSAVTSSWPSANATVATGNSGGPLSVTVPFNGRTFYLYNNAQQLATRSAAADCASGTTWNGNVCQAQTSGTLSLSPSSCTIGAGAAACNVSVSWNTTNPVGTSAVTSNWPNANTTVATGNSGGPLSVTVPFGGRAFYLYNNTEQLASRSANAGCASGTTWNGNACQAQTTGTLSLSPSSCTIAAGSGACNVSISWNTSNPVGTSAVTSSWPSANTTVATGNSGGPVSVAVPFNGRTFYLYNNTQQLASRSATASCASGTTWNGSTCHAATTGTLSLSPSSCTIASGASTCNVSVSWNTSNPVGTSAVTSSWPSANTTVATGNSGGPVTASVPFGGRTFYLYNNTQQLASRSATASCAPGTSWNGSKCQPLPTTGTLTLSSSSCTIANGASTCNVSVSWSTTNPVGVSAVTSSWPSANTTVATGNSGGPVSVAVPFNGRAFYLYNNAQQLASRSATAKCVSGTTWNGSACR